MESNRRDSSTSSTSSTSRISSILREAQNPIPYELSNLNDTLIDMHGELIAELETQAKLIQTFLDAAVQGEVSDAQSTRVQRVLPPARLEMVAEAAIIRVKQMLA